MYQNTIMIHYFVNVRIYVIEFLVQGLGRAFQSTEVPGYDFYWRMRHDVGANGHQMPFLPSLTFHVGTRSLNPGSLGASSSPSAAA